MSDVHAAQERLRDWVKTNCPITTPKRWDELEAAINALTDAAIQDGINRESCRAIHDGEKQMQFPTAASCSLTVKDSDVQSYG